MPGTEGFLRERPLNRGVDTTYEHGAQLTKLTYRLGNVTVNMTGKHDVEESYGSKYAET